MNPICMTIQMEATEKYFHVVLFILVFKVVLNSKPVDETLVYDHSNVRLLISTFTL